MNLGGSTSAVKARRRPSGDQASSVTAPWSPVLAKRTGASGSLEIEQGDPRGCVVVPGIGSDEREGLPVRAEAWPGVPNRAPGELPRPGDRAPTEVDREQVAVVTGRP